MNYNNYNHNYKEANQKSYYYRVYVLKLEHNKYYVGITKDINKRFKDHQEGRGAKFTQIYKPIKIEKTFKTSCRTYFDVEPIENGTTIKYMKKYGRENVRGGKYLAVNQDKVNELLGESRCNEIDAAYLGKKKNKNKPKKDPKTKKEIRTKKDPKAKNCPMIDREDNSPESKLELIVIENIGQCGANCIRDHYVLKDKFNQLRKVTIALDYKKHKAYVSKRTYCKHKDQLDNMFKKI